MAAPVGNNNAGKNKPWQEAIRRALARAEDEGNYRSLNALADKLLDKASEGDMSAIRELGDRLDGKAQQDINAALSGEMRMVLPPSDANL